MKKRLLTLLCAALLLLSLTVPVLADGFNYVYDPDGWFSDDHIDELNEAAEAAYGVSGARILFAITDSSVEKDFILNELFIGPDDNALLVYVDLEAEMFRCRGLGSCAALADDQAHMDQLFTILNEADSWFAGAFGYINAAGAMAQLAKLSADGVVAYEYPDEAPDALPDEEPAADIAEDTSEEPAEPAPTPVPTPEPTPMPFTLVMDEADILSENEESDLRAQLEDISARLGRDVAVITVDSMAPYSSPEQFCDHYFAEHDYAKDTILLMLSMGGGVGNRDFCISAHGNCEILFPAETRELISTDILPLLSSGSYFRAISDFGSYCDEYTEYYEETGKPYTPPLPSYWILIALCVGLLAASGVTLGMKSQLKSVHAQNSAAQYIRPGSFSLTQSREHFLYSHVDRVAKPKDTGGSGGGGRGSIHSSGHSTSGKF